MPGIHKYTVKRVDGGCVVEMPIGAQIVSCQAQHGAVAIWALVDPYRPPEKRFFAVFHTGEMFGDRPDLRFVGTVQFDEGKYVVHVFEICRR